MSYTYARAVRGRHTRNRLDEPGRIRITVTRVAEDGRSHSRGNIMRCLTLEHGTVGEVFGAIERHIIGAAPLTDLLQ